MIRNRTSGGVGGRRGLSLASYPILRHPPSAPKIRARHEWAANEFHFHLQPELRNGLLSSADAPSQKGAGDALSARRGGGVLVAGIHATGRRIHPTATGRRRYLCPAALEFGFKLATATRPVAGRIELLPSISSVF